MEINIDDAEYQKTVDAIKIVYKVRSDSDLQTLIENLVHQYLHIYRMNMAEAAKAVHDKATYDKLTPLV
jgi:hypothetical protein